MKIIINRVYQKLDGALFIKLIEIALKIYFLLQFYCTSKIHDSF